MMNLQSKIGTDGFMLAIKLYSDDTKVSRFRDTTFHAITACLANIPHFLRNSHGVGGSLLLANIPKVLISNLA
jgi:hypothetical protein